MHSISLMWVNKDVLPNIAAIPRTNASNAMNCFPRHLIVLGISDQTCLEGIIIYFSVLMRRSDMKLIKYKKDMKQNWVILTWAVSCFAGCIVLLHSEGKTQEETGMFGVHLHVATAEERSVLLAATPPRHVPACCTMGTGDYKSFLLTWRQHNGLQSVLVPFLICSILPEGSWAGRYDWEVPPGNWLKVSTAVPTESQSQHPVSWSIPTLLKANCPWNRKVCMK